MVFKSDGHGSAGKPSDQSTPGKSLEVDHPVVMLLAHFLDDIECHGPSGWFSPTMPIEWNDFGNIGIAFQQRDKLAICPPVDFRPGKLVAEEARNREGLDHIAERTRLKNQNFHGKPGSEPHSSSPETSIQPEAFGVRREILRAVGVIRTVSSSTESLPTDVALLTVSLCLTRIRIHRAGLWNPCYLEETLRPQRFALRMVPPGEYWELLAQRKAFGQAIR